MYNNQLKKTINKQTKIELKKICKELNGKTRKSLVCRPKKNCPNESMDRLDEAMLVKILTTRQAKANLCE